MLFGPKFIFNKTIIDTTWTFNKAIIFNDNKALIIPIDSWKDYEGEQLQVVTKQGQTLLLSIYNSKLVYDEKSKMKAYDFAKMYVGENGLVTDLSSNENTNSFNYDIIDTKFTFNKAMIMKDDAITILSIDQWNDYEGEQLQIKIGEDFTMLTAAYDTILINDQNSDLKANDIASLLSENINDFSNEESKGLFNKQILDLNYGFSSSIISGENSMSAVNIKQWTDYEGEQIQIILNTNDVILGTSMTLKLLNGGTDKLNSSVISKVLVNDKGKIIDEVNGLHEAKTYNKTFIDLGNNSFKYALKINDGNVAILPLKSWRDYYNSDKTTYYVDSNGNIRSKTVDGEGNCEQLQLILPDDTVVLTTAYNTILVDNVRDIKEIAELFRGEDKTIIDLTGTLGEPNQSTWNKSLFDLKYYFNKAIISNGDKNMVLDVKKWLDFADGEQLQITFDDDSNILTSYYNTTLVYSKTENIEYILADAFQGISDENILSK